MPPDGWIGVRINVVEGIAANYSFPSIAIRIACAWTEPVALSERPDAPDRDQQAKAEPAAQQHIGFHFVPLKTWQR
jgi:hypothetical protein